MAGKRKSRDWLVCLPLSDLNLLIGQADDFDQLKEENLQLRREMEALRNQYTELLIQFNELRKLRM